ncbi:possible transporter, partial [Thalassiosira pseudonana CCMP1335]
RKYLVVYLLAALSDWLQGPYVYALYDAYGYSQHDIAVLFVAGFGSSMVFGSFVGGMADQCGRRKFVILFSVIYALSCMTKHFKNFQILMIGRLLGGVATSLLFSVFEAWLIGAHANAGVMSHLGKSFSMAQYGNSIVAIIAGQIANRAANYAEFKPTSDDSGFYTGGYLGPFDVSLVALVACGLLGATLWEENYGKTTKSSASGALKNAFTATIRSPDILSCGIISSLFEGSMYIFVFMWTPALTTLAKEEMGDSFEGLPFGIIFSTFMVCCMAGSSIFSIAMEKLKPEQLAVTVFGVAALAFAMVVFSTNATSTFLAMNLFEVCVGMYFPSMGTMKGMIVPEDKRAAIYNLFRIPLNFIVLFSLLTDLSPKTSFTLCGTMMVIATFL